MFYRFVHSVIIPLLRLMFRVRVTGRENIPDGPALICANHTAMIDPFVIAVAFNAKDPLRFMTKGELFRVPVLRSFLKAVGAYPVERGQSDMAALRQSVDTLKQGGKLLMFPEGTRVKYRGELPPKPGAAMIAVRAGVPVLPVYLSYPKRLFRRTTLIFGAPFVPELQAGSGSSEQYRALAASIHKTVWNLGEPAAPPSGEGESNP